jgi:NADH dehydrogenase FAD-containing subunit
MAKILILGGGFAAIAAVEVLSKTVTGDDEITVVSINSEFIFSPALVPMVFGYFEPNEIHFDVRVLLKEHGVRFVQGKVASVDPEGRKVRVTSGPVDEILDFDYLLIAIGRSLAVRNIPGLFDHSYHLLTLPAALKFRKAISDFDTGSIVVGLCPDASLPVPVCETALGLARKFEQKMADGAVTVTVVFPSTLERALAGSALFRDLDSEFDRKGTNLVHDFPVAKVDHNSILSKFGPTIDHDLLMLVPAFKGQGQQRDLAPMADENGFLPVNEFMRVKGFDRIYAAGDVVALPGPKFGYMAIRQGKVAANNIVAEIAREVPTSVYMHDLEWVIGEKHTHPVLFHYGFWDETLADFDPQAFFGMARQLRERYGELKVVTDGPPADQ